MKKKVCVIVPFKEFSDRVEKCLESILDLEYPDFEVIFVDDSKNFLSNSFLKNFKDKIKILNSYGKGPSFARNLAAKSTSAELLAFTDSDCIVSRDWLRELIRGLENIPQSVSCGGRQEIPPDASEFEKKVFLFMKRVGFITDYMKRSTLQEIISTFHNPSCNVMYKREIFIKEGGFLEGLWPGEDVELDYRLRKKGYKLVFNPKAIVYHYRPQNLKAFLKMMYRYGASSGILTKRYGFFRKIQIVPVLFFLNNILFFLSILFNFYLFFFVFYSIIFLFLLIYFKFDFELFRICCLGFLYWNFGFFKEYLLTRRGKCLGGKEGKNYLGVPKKQIKEENQI